MMRPDAKVEKVYLYPKPVDFRKSIDGLAALVELDIKVAVFDPVLFVFRMRSINPTLWLGGVYGSHTHDATRCKSRKSVPLPQTCASAQLYSLVETAKANGQEPYAWLRHALERLPTATSVEDYEASLPWNCEPRLHS